MGPAPPGAQHPSRSLILLRTNMDAGHGGRSGRYRGLEEIAEIYAFLIGLSATGSPD